MQKFNEIGFWTLFLDFFWAPFVGTVRTITGDSLMLVMYISHDINLHKV